MVGGCLVLDKKNRRSVANIIVDPGALLRLSIPFIFLLLASVVSIFLVHKQITLNFESLEYPQQQSLELQLILNQIANRAMLTGVIAMLVIGVLTLVMWIIYSHRMLGPVVPLRKHVEKLCDGNYDDRIRLRKHDEFKELAADLNRLTEILKNKKSL